MMVHETRLPFVEPTATFTLCGRLPVMVIEKKGFHKTFVSLSVPFGALHRNYTDAKGNRHPLPAGLAHFLEHKIFEQADGDVSKHFTRDEAQVNAYTEHARTTFLFSATNHIVANAARLVDMVFHPRFTTAGIEREKGVIMEEIRQYADNPYHLQYLTLMDSLYHTHPLAEDILGSLESVMALDEQTLKRAHSAYYKPERCRLVIIGDVDAGALLQGLEDIVRLPEPSSFTETPVPIAPLPCEQAPPIRLEQDIGTPNVLFAFPLDPGPPGKERTRRYYAMSTLFDLVFGKSGHFYETWLDEGLINDAYGIDIQYESTHAYAVVMTESAEPEKFCEAFRNAVASLADLPLEEADFLRLKKQNIGSFVMALDSLEHLAHEAIRTAEEGLFVHDVLDVIRSVSFAEVKRLRHDIDLDRLRCLKAYPKQRKPQGPDR